MSDGGKVPRKGVLVGGKETPPPSAEGFLSLVSLWDQPEDDAEVEIEEVDPLQVLQEQEEEFKQRGEEIIRVANEEATRIEEEAYRKGFAQGEDAGHAAGKKNFDDAVQRIEVLFAALNVQLTERNKRYEDELLLLVKTMVDRLVHHEVSINPRVIQACLKQALSFVIEKSVARVHLHPDDFSRIREASLGDPSLLDGKKRIELMEDASVAEGGCYLETDFGDVDATLEHGREKLYDAVDKAFRVSFAEGARVAEPGVVEAAPVEEPVVSAGSDVDEIAQEQVTPAAPVVPAEAEPAGVLSSRDDVSGGQISQVVPAEPPEAEPSGSSSLDAPAE